MLDWSVRKRERTAPGARRRDLDCALLAVLGLGGFSCDSSGTVLDGTDASTDDGAAPLDAMAPDAAAGDDAQPAEAANGDAGDASTEVGDGPGPSPDADLGDAGGCIETQDPDSGECNTLSNDAPLVTYACGMGAPPTLTGGTPIDGTYFSTAGKDYRSGCGLFYFPSPTATTWQLTGGCLKQATLALVQGYRVTVNYTFTPLGGGSARLTQTCPSGSSSTTVGYSATPTTITLFDPGTTLTGGTLIVMTRQ